MDTKVISTITSHAPAIWTRRRRKSSACRRTSRSNARCSPTAVSAWRRRPARTTDIRWTLRWRNFSPPTERHTMRAYSTPTPGNAGLQKRPHHHRPAGRLWQRKNHWRLQTNRPLWNRLSDRGQAGAEGFHRKRDDRRCDPLTRGAFEQIVALKLMKEMAASYGCDISPSRFQRAGSHSGHLFRLSCGSEEQNGAAMSLGRTSTFLDIYAERDLALGTFTEEQIQEFVDHFIMKLRIIKFARTPEYNELFSATRYGSPSPWQAWVWTAATWRRRCPSATCIPDQPGSRAGAEPGPCSGPPGSPSALALLREDVHPDLFHPVRKRRSDASCARRRLRHRLLRFFHADR